MKSKFVLIHSKEGVEEAKARIAAATRTSTLETVKLAATHYGGALLDGIEAGGKLLSSVFSPAETTAPSDAPKTTTKSGRRFSSSPKPDRRLTVGIWSLDAWLGSLSQLIDGLNQTQRTFIFYEVEASVPAGLISRPERVIPWLEEALEKNPSKDLRESLAQAKQKKGDNLIANDFFPLADSVRTDLGLDYIVGITPSMVAGEDTDGSYYTDHFSTYDGHTILASSYDLQRYASESGIAFEAFLAAIVISELLVAICPKLGFHPDTGCLFDYNDDRDSLIRDVRNPLVEASCIDLIEPQYRDATKSFVDFIRSIRESKQ
jgi:hypothetical protein